jgi:hypothetical protein
MVEQVDGVLAVVAGHGHEFIQGLGLLGLVGPRVAQAHYVRKFSFAHLG